MINELLIANKGTKLRINGNETLKITINKKEIKDIFLINGNSFKTEHITQSDLAIKPNKCYMIINNSIDNIELSYNLVLSCILIRIFKFIHRKLLPEW